MTASLEDLIREAQQRQAARAVPERILARLPVYGARRARRRRSGRLVVAAVCAVGLAVAVVPVAIHMSEASSIPVAAALWSGTVPDFGQLASPRIVWPEAVHRIPDTLPGGSQYTVSAVLGSGRYLVKSDVSVGAAPDGIAYWPAIFDSAAGTAQPISPASADRDGTALADAFVAGDRVLWGCSGSPGRTSCGVPRWTAGHQRGLSRRGRWPGPRTRSASRTRWSTGGTPGTRRRCPASTRCRSATG
ncbi:hypothetical protein ACFQ1L_19435 [Phytohabitans flavus]|uniref:hypothetical protein n=1 Tax=Phytohabitans flavus TaxID=1076124 RepID=UPI001563B444|nr:hypothetical protein [Phytohabitans flavus]